MTNLGKNNHLVSPCYTTAPVQFVPKEIPPHTLLQSVYITVAQLLISAPKEAESVPAGPSAKPLTTTLPRTRLNLSRVPVCVLLETGGHKPESFRRRHLGTIGTTDAQPSRDAKLHEITQRPGLPPAQQGSSLLAFPCVFQSPLSET